MSLKPGVSTPSLDASFKSARYRLDKAPEGGLRDGVQLDLQNLDQAGQGSRLGVVRSQIIPEVLDQAKSGEYAV